MTKERQKEWRRAAALNLSALAVTLGYMCFTVRTGIFCPIRHFTGIPCAGCGMSRALGCLLRLDVAGSLHQNPALLPCVAAVFFLLNRETVVLSRLPMWLKDTVIGIGFGTTLAVYAIRMLTTGIP